MAAAILIVQHCVRLHLFQKRPSQRKCNFLSITSSTKVAQNSTILYLSLSQKNDFVERGYLTDHAHGFIMVQVFVTKHYFKNEEYDGHNGSKHIKKFSDLEIVNRMKRLS